MLPALFPQALQLLLCLICNPAILILDEVRDGFLKPKQTQQQQVSAALLLPGDAVPTLQQLAAPARKMHPQIIGGSIGAFAAAGLLRSTSSKLPRLGPAAVSSTRQPNVKALTVVAPSPSIDRGLVMNLSGVLAASAVSRGLLLPLFVIIYDHPSAKSVFPLMAVWALIIGFLARSTAQCHLALGIVLGSGSLAAIIAFMSDSLESLALARLVKELGFVTPALVQALALWQMGGISICQASAVLGILCMVDSLGTALGETIGMFVLQAPWGADSVPMHLLCLASLAASGTAIGLLASASTRRQRARAAKTMEGQMPMPKAGMPASSPRFGGANALGVVCLFISIAMVTASVQLHTERTLFTPTPRLGAASIDLVIEACIRLVVQGALAGQLCTLCGDLAMFTGQAVVFFSILAQLPARLQLHSMMVGVCLVETSSMALVHSLSPAPMWALALCMLHAVRALAPALVLERLELLGDSIPIRSEVALAGAALMFGLMSRRAA